jgi:FkbH-like protein
VILLLGQCGLERLAEPLRAAGHTVTVAGWSQVELVETLAPALVYVDLFDWELSLPLVGSALRGEPIRADLDVRRLVVDALRTAPVVYRAPRPLPAGWCAPDPVTPQLAALIAEAPQIDLSGLWARHGILSDAVRFGPGHGEAELGELGRSRLSGESAAEVEARAVHGHWLSRTGRGRKCLVVDLDGTLIHGLISDDTFPTANPAWDPSDSDVEAESAWWRVPRGLHLSLRALQGRGVLLALATRNDLSTVHSRFRRRPPVPGPAGAALSLCLDVDDFVIVEAGFGPKSEMCQRIAASLGIATDALVFVDDSPFERLEVQTHLPEVLVVDPNEAWRLVELAELQAPSPTAATSLRAASYQSRLATAATSAADLEQFLVDLDLWVSVRPAQIGDLPRVRELFLRTNQLVLNGDRPQPHTVDGVWVASVRDRLADHGLVAAGLFGRGTDGDSALLAWACSCRVLPHRVAASILWRMCRQHGDVRIQREDTGRNGAARGLIEEAAKGPARWVHWVEED